MRTPPDLDTPTILVVDDEELITSLLRAVLEREGYRVYVARTGREAVDLARKVAPSLIMMDIVMPDLDGYEATSLIKQNPSLQDIPVIFLSGRSADEDKGQAFEEGAATFLRKPFSNEQIVSLVALIMQSVTER